MIGLLLLLVLVPVSGSQGKYDLGRTATPEEIRARNISVFPDGTGLPPGHGSAKEGRAIYALRCAACHGAKGEGIAPYPRLAGGLGTLKNDKPVITIGSYWPYATTVWDYIHRSMPPESPGILKPDEIYATTAYVLYLNDIVKEDEVLNAESLPRIRMPNRNGFVPDSRPDTKSPSRSKATPK